ncbi:toxin Cry1Ac domain D-VI-related protein [Breznakia pachnodae]|uniref:LPXTG-motif cell wall-anchored protein n=1 Tax=Breznakia pachnodae TaxID=265178 RepID=A0ABU0E218_9FIRM|nr:toxin Cry1Ac domain D-VI-related protein [Breznakia pachnodae]MDQ0360928.1 LPXTG-motif cell wall-anchored protein [Breznakia pachnodae]
MKKRIRSKKLISSLAISTLVLGLFVTTVINADESEVTTEPEIQEVEEITEEEIIEEEQEVVEEETVDEEEVIESYITSTSEAEQVDRSSLARVDLTANAFSESSRPLEQAILNAYTVDGIDGSTPDGYISIGEANAYSGEIVLSYATTNNIIGGGLDGIENFTQITLLNLRGNQLSGSIPASINMMSSLTNLDLGENLIEGEIPSSIGLLTSLTDLRLDTNNLTGQIPSSIKNLINLTHLRLNSNNLEGNDEAIFANMTSLTYFTYHYNPKIKNLNLSGLTNLDTVSISSAINLNLDSTRYFYISGTHNYEKSLVSLYAPAGGVNYSYDESTGYYVINKREGISYRVVVTYKDDDGNIVRVVSTSVELSDGGLMDIEGNLIIGATVDDVIDGKVHLPNGGKVVTGEATYTFDGNTTISEEEISTEGNVKTEKHIPDGTTVDFVGITTETNNSNGTVIIIDLMDSKGTTTLKPGSIVTNNDGDKVYISDEAIMDNEGNITSSGTYVTVASDKTATTNSDGTITLPETSTVTVNGEDTVYPGTIIFSPEDGSLKYIPVSELLNEDGTDLATGITQKEIDDARTLVDGLTNGNLKDQLTEIVDTAQNILNAKEAVEDLFTDDSHTDIPDDLTQTDIDKAQELVDKVPNGKLKDELQKEIDKAQDMLNARDKVNNLFTDDTHTDIPDDLTQTDIDDAQKTVDKLPSGDLKDELQKEIDKAQNMLDAKDKVDNLFTDNTHTDITGGLTQKDIDKAQDAVDKLPDGALKDELQKEIDKAQDMLNAQDAVGDLLDKDGNLNSGVTQDDINKAQYLVNKLPDGDLKDELQAIIDEAQRQLDAKNVKNPSTAPTTNKPSLAATSTTGGDNVNTADTTNLSLYLGLLAISLGGIVLMKRKKANVK